MDKEKQPGTIKKVIEDSIANHFIGAGKRNQGGDHIFGLALPGHENEYVIRFRKSSKLIEALPQGGYHPTQRLKDLLATSALTPPKFLFPHARVGQPLLQCITINNILKEPEVAFDITQRQPGETVQAWLKDSPAQFTKDVVALPDAKLDHFFESLFYLIESKELPSDFHFAHNIMFDPKEGFFVVDKLKERTYATMPSESTLDDRVMLSVYEANSKKFIDIFAEAGVRNRLLASLERVQNRIANHEKPFDKRGPVFADVTQVAAAPLRGELRFQKSPTDTDATQKFTAKDLLERLQGLEQAIGIA